MLLSCHNSRDCRLPAAQVFVLFCWALIAALLVPELSFHPGDDRTLYLRWASLACLLPAWPGFLLRQRYPAALTYFRAATAFGLVCYLFHAAWASANDLDSWWTWPLAIWWIGDAFAALTTAGGTGRAGSRLCRSLFLIVASTTLAVLAWQDGELLGRLLGLGLIASLLIGADWRWHVVTPCCRPADRS